MVSRKKIKKILSFLQLLISPPDYREIFKKNNYLIKFTTSVGMSSLCKFMN
jgi:hypothetical protein